MVLHPTQHTWCEHSELFWHGTASQQSSRQRVRENVVAVQEKACAARPQPDHTLRVQPHRRTSCVPCEKFMRAQRIPASYKPLSFSTGCVMGPTARARSATNVQLRSVPVHTWVPAGHTLCPKRDTHANSLQHKGPVSLECGVGAGARSAADVQRLLQGLWEPHLCTQSWCAATIWAASFRTFCRLFGQTRAVVFV